MFGCARNTHDIRALHVMLSMEQAFEPGNQRGEVSLVRDGLFKI
jgi:hypothetical protein